MIPFPKAHDRAKVQGYLQRRSLPAEHSPVFDCRAAFTDLRGCMLYSQSVIETASCVVVIGPA